MQYLKTTETSPVASATDTLLDEISNILVGVPAGNAYGEDETAKAISLCQPQLSKLLELEDDLKKSRVRVRHGSPTLRSVSG